MHLYFFIDKWKKIEYFFWNVVTISWHFNDDSLIENIQIHCLHVLKWIVRPQNEQPSYYHEERSIGWKLNKDDER